MTPEQLPYFIVTLYTAACFTLYGVISLISKFEDEFLSGESNERK